MGIFLSSKIVLNDVPFSRCEVAASWPEETLLQSFSFSLLQESDSIAFDSDECKGFVRELFLDLDILVLILILNGNKLDEKYEYM